MQVENYHQKIEGKTPRYREECKETPVVPVIDVKDEDETDQPELEPFILCRRCRRIITRPEDRININGAHAHTFTNPHGIVYEIGCFQTAGGGAHVGSSSNEFTWFPGYTWRMVVCASCLGHLGWSFTASGGDRFYGLILENLVNTE